MDSKGFGKKGEQSAASFLCGKGFTIIGRNIRMNHLETDIIAKNGFEDEVTASVKVEVE